MPLTRTASVADSSLIAAHRKAMFVAMGRPDDARMDSMARHFEPWCARMIEQGKYIGWITEDQGLPIASAGLLILDWPPHPLDPAAQQRGYVLNVFVEPEFRRRGLAHALLDLCLAEARQRDLRVVALHSSEAGRPIYENSGFRISNEMIFVEPEEG